METCHIRKCEKNVKKENQPSDPELIFTYFYDINEMLNPNKAVV